MQVTKILEENPLEANEATTEEAEKLISSSGITQIYSAIFSLPSR